MMFCHQSGSGIKSKFNYTSGFFHINIKLPANDSGGVVTAFYLKSEDSELDFEFLGNRKGKPIGVQTNAFLKGKGVESRGSIFGLIQLRTSILTKSYGTNIK
ncbi:hypothetical protein CsSME_00041714 [Camellia sinensis var. sinensis]